LFFLIAMLEDVVLDWEHWELSQLGVEPPALVGSVVTVPVDQPSLVGVSSSVDIEALAESIGDGLLVALPPVVLLVDLLSVSSHDSWSSDSVSLSGLVGDGEASGSVSSDGLSSGVEDEPLSVVLGVGVSDSESVLGSGPSLSPVDSSLRSQVSSNLELSSVLLWVGSLSLSVGVDVPGLVESIVAVPESDWLVFFVRSTIDVEALVSCVSDVSSGSSEPFHLLIWLVSVLSCNSPLSDSEVLSVQVGESEVSSHL